MDPLVEQLKKQSEVDIQERNNQIALRLHNAAIIKAKAPAFWSLVDQRICELCAELRQTFPSDNRKHLSLEHLPNGFFLNGSKIPRYGLSAELDVIGQQVVLSERITFAREDSPMTKAKTPITLTVEPEEEIIFRFQEGSYDTSHDLARALVKRVLEFPEVKISCSLVA